MERILNYLILFISATSAMSCVNNCASRCQTPQCIKACIGNCDVSGRTLTKPRTPCCHIVHPKHCYQTNTPPYQTCYAKKHRECSNMCTSNYIHFIPAEQLPQPQQIKPQCHYIQKQPYVYCGQYALQNCDKCYLCGGGYNPKYCRTQSGCSNSCKRSLSPHRPALQPPAIPGARPMQGLQAAPKYIPPQGLRMQIQQPHALQKLGRPVYGRFPPHFVPTPQRHVLQGVQGPLRQVLPKMQDFRTYRHGNARFINNKRCSKS